MKLARALGGGAVLLGGSYLAGTQFRSKERVIIPPANTNSDEYKCIQNHPFVQQLRQTHNESRYYDLIPAQHRENMVTSGILASDGALTVEPFVFTNKDETEMTFFYHLGNEVAGHEGIVHGGLLATILDEGLSRCAFPSLPNKYGVTAKLEISYKKPVPTSSYLVLEAKVIESKGRKVVSEGIVHTLDDKTPLVKGKAIMIEPKWAKYFIWLLE